MGSFAEVRKDCGSLVTCTKFTMISFPNKNNFMKILLVRGKIVNMKNMGAVTNDSNFQPSKNKTGERQNLLHLVTRKMTVLRDHPHFFRHGLQQWNWSGVFHYYGKKKSSFCKDGRDGYSQLSYSHKSLETLEILSNGKIYMCIRKFTVVMGKLKP